MTTNHLDETVRMAALVVSLEPDELQGLRAITEVDAAASGREADLGCSAMTLMHAALKARLEELGLRWNPSPEAIQQRAALEMRPAGPVIALMKNDRARKLVVSGLAVAALIELLRHTTGPPAPPGCGGRDAGAGRRPAGSSPRRRGLLRRS